MSVECFIDTNVFIYQIEAQDDFKYTIANRIIGEAIATSNACISYQVVQECLNTIYRKAEIPLDGAQTRDYLHSVLAPLCRVYASTPLYERAIDVRERWRFSFYDSLIVAAALAAGCTRLYSEDLQHGQKIERLTIENPFKS